MKHDRETDRPYGFTHCYVNKMNDICRRNFKCDFLVGNSILVHISLYVVPEYLINNKSAVVQVMAWHQTDDKSLFEPVLARFHGNMLCH